MKPEQLQKDEKTLNLGKSPKAQHTKESLGQAYGHTKSSKVSLYLGFNLELEALRGALRWLQAGRVQGVSCEAGTVFDNTSICTTICHIS